MEIPAMHIGQKLKKIRELKNFTQTHIASELGITQSAYSKIELGETDVTYVKLTRIAEVLGVSAEEIVSFNEHMIFNVMHNHNGNGLVVHKGVSENEKKLYEEQISVLKEEISYLKKVLDKLMRD